MVRATRMMLEHMLQNRLTMEGTPRGNARRLDMHKMAIELSGCDQPLSQSQLTTQPDFINLKQCSKLEYTKTCRAQ